MSTRFFIFLTAIFCMFGCQETDSYPDELSGQMTSFLDIVESRDWESLYLMQSQEYRSNVPMEIFRKQMEKNRNETALLSFKFLGGKVASEKAVVSVVYRLTSSKLGSSGAEFEYRNIAQFARDDNGDWMLEGAGLDMYFPILSNP